MDRLVATSYVAGVLIMALLCWKDLDRALANRPHTKLSRALIFVIFYAISLLIYFILCSIISIETGTLKGELTRIQPDPTALQGLKPLAVTFLGFGLGDASFFLITQITP